jgi:hypothetical protein
LNLNANSKVGGLLDVEGPKIETSVLADGKIKEIDITETVTYRIVPRSKDVLYGEGVGVIISKDSRDSGETATYTAQGIGKFVGSGRKSFRGSLFFSSLSTGKLAFLNNLVGVFEDEVDEAGNTWAKAWERK